jgi:hypothetical protein
MENNAETQQMSGSPSVEPSAVPTDETTKVEQLPPTSLIQSLLLEQPKGIDDQKKKKVKTVRQKELVNIFILGDILFDRTYIGTFDKSNENDIYLIGTIKHCLRTHQFILIRS